MMDTCIVCDLDMGDDDGECPECGDTLHSGCSGEECPSCRSLNERAAVRSALFPTAKNKSVAAEKAKPSAAPEPPPRKPSEGGKYNIGDGVLIEVLYEDGKFNTKNGEVMTIKASYPADPGYYGLGTSRASAFSDLVVKQLSK